MKKRNYFFLYLLSFIISISTVLAQEASEVTSKAGAWWGAVSLFVVIALLYIFWKEGKLQQLFHKQKEHDVHKPQGDLENLDKFVRTQLNEGHEPAHIRTALLEAGWKKELVNDMLKKYKE